jgi:hypothetical protein
MNIRNRWLKTYLEVKSRGKKERRKIKKEKKIIYRVL